jgi:hypothetical protein
LGDASALAILAHSGSEGHGHLFARRIVHSATISCACEVPRNRVWLQDWGIGLLFVSLGVCPFLLECRNGGLQQLFAHASLA